MRTHTCGELRSKNIGESITLVGWVQRSRDLGGMTFIDLRDRYGITQLVFNMETHASLCEDARKLGREYVIQISGNVLERTSKNSTLPTGDIEIKVEKLTVLNTSKVPPFILEEETDGGEDLRMAYRYLDLRRPPVFEKMALRHRVAQEIRNYLDQKDFIEVETPVLIKSTPEGARDFVVPSRIHPGEFYALPQSPQTFKQLLMVGGLDRYYQLVKCFRDEDLRADRQPEFTQLDCEMSFVTQEDVLQTFEGLAQHLFQELLNVQVGDFPRMPYDEAIKDYGSDKPDIRFGMKFHELDALAKGKGFRVFDDAELVVGICAKACAQYSRKQLDELTEFVKKPQIGAKGLVYVKCLEDGQYKSSVDKFFGQEELKGWAVKMGAQAGDLLLILAGKTAETRNALCQLRLEMGDRLDLKDPKKFAPLWVVDFPFFEKDEETGQLHAIHHPFTSPKEEDADLLESKPESVRANAYDMVINGVEIGGGSIRIHDKKRQQQIFGLLGFSDQEANEQFGFLMNAFEYGAPPHGGAAFGFDRWVALFGLETDIKEFIAFPKNNAGRDVMINAPSPISDEQLKELHLRSHIEKGEVKSS